MSTQTASIPITEVVADTGSPNQYRLQGHGLRISYYPGGAGPLTVNCPTIVSCQDANESLVFRSKQAQVVAVVDLASDKLVTQTSLSSPR